MQFYSGRLLIKIWLVQYRKSQLFDWGMFLVLCGSTREDYLPRCDQSKTPNFNCFTTKYGRSWIIHLELKYTSSSTFPFLYWYVAELVSCIFIILILNTVVICTFLKPEYFWLYLTTHSLLYQRRWRSSNIFQDYFTGQSFEFKMEKFQFGFFPHKKLMHMYENQEVF